MKAGAVDPMLPTLLVGVICVGMAAVRLWHKAIPGEVRAGQAVWLMIVIAVSVLLYVLRRAPCGVANATKIPFEVSLTQVTTET